MSTFDSVGSSGHLSPEGTSGTQGRGVRASALVPSWMIVSFLVVLNLVAMGGQAAWFYEHVVPHGKAGWAAAIGIALVVEMIGVYLSSMAHASLMANQSAGLLRFGSYAVGLLVGALNYAHYSTVLAAAVTFGALSTISPWLWAVYSRFVNRDRLAELGLVDARGVKLSTSRKFWHPVKSTKVIRYAAWEGITDPATAVRAWEMDRSDPAAPVSPALPPLPAVRDDVEADRKFYETMWELKEGRTWKQVAEHLNVTEKTLYNRRKAWESAR